MPTTANNETLERIKDEVCEEVFQNAYDDWVLIPAESIMHDEIAKRYARACIEASLKEAADNATFDQKEIQNGLHFIIDKSSITDEKNIKLL